MPRLRLLWLAAVIALLTGASAWAQQPPKMSADLTRDVRDAKVQEQLIALGVLDATAGRASTGELSEAVAWFRKAHQSNRGMAGLSDDEKEILKQAKAKFDAATGLEVAVYRSRNPKTTTDIALLVPRTWSQRHHKHSRTMPPAENCKSIAVAKWPLGRWCTCCPTSRLLPCSGRASCRWR